MSFLFGVLSYKFIGYIPRKVGHPGSRWGLGSKVEGLSFRLQSLGSKVWGFKFRL